jgi:hypothetical protein
VPKKKKRTAPLGRRGCARNTDRRYLAKQERLTRADLLERVPKNRSLPRFVTTEDLDLILRVWELDKKDWDGIVQRTLRRRLISQMVKSRPA